MAIVNECPIPEGTALYSIAQEEGVYTDCYTTGLDIDISFADYVAAFYTTRIFKAERFVLALLARAPSSDDEARQLAMRGRDHFAIWRVQLQTDTQLLMQAGRTRSWLMIDHDPGQSHAKTRLMFGSVVMPITNHRTGQPKMGALFSAFLGGHKLYSKLLLSGARKQLLRSAARAQK
jgi:hypothetical protein